MSKANLEAAIATLTSEFARAIAKAIRDASLGELTSFVADGAGLGRKVRTPRLGWPKCPVCGKNAWPRGKGYCFEHSTASTTGKPSGKKRAGRASKPAEAK